MTLPESDLLPSSFFTMRNLSRSVGTIVKKRHIKYLVYKNHVFACIGEKYTLKEDKIKIFIEFIVC